MQENIQPAPDVSVPPALDLMCAVSEPSHSQVIATPPNRPTRKTEKRAELRTDTGKTLVPELAPATADPGTPPQSLQPVCAGNDLMVAPVSEKVFLTAAERAERAKEIKRLLAEAQEHTREDAIHIGLLLRDAHDRIEEGGWGKFCFTAGITRRKADMYRFIAISKVAPLLRGIKFSVCLVLARFALRGHAEMTTVLDLLMSEDITALTINGLKLRLGIQPDPKPASGLLLWAVGQLHLPRTALSESHLLSRAQAQYNWLVERLPEEKDLVTQALSVLMEAAC